MHGTPARQRGHKPDQRALVARLGAAALGLRAGDRGRGGRLRAFEPGDPSN
jgi:hypothetical protein